MRVPQACCALLLAAVTLAACAQKSSAVPAAPPPPVMVDGECDAQAAQFAVGKIVDAPLIAQAKDRSRAERVRVLRPGVMVTMEFDARRLNIDVDEKGRVLSVRCG